MTQSLCEKINEHGAVSATAAVSLAFLINEQFGYVRAKDDTPYNPSSLKRLMHAISEYVMQESEAASSLELLESTKKTMSNMVQGKIDDKQRSYLTSALMVLSQDVIALSDTNSIAVIASIPEACKKMNKINTEKAGQGLLFGEIRQRGPLKLRLLFEPTLDQSRTFPVMRFYFEDDNGLHFTWFASESSAPKHLVVGQCYTLTGTIDKHYEDKRKETVTTVISRCTDFTEVPRDSQPPNFTQTANSRSVPDKISISFSVKNEKGEIDGTLHIIINRRWSEQGKIRTLRNIYVAVDDWVSYPERLHALIAHWCISLELKRNTQSLSKTDRRLFCEITKRTSHLFARKSELSEQLFFVDDAQNPASKPITNSDLHAERKKRRLFLSAAEAKSFSLSNDKQISLISEIQTTKMRFFFYPSEIQTLDGFDAFMLSINPAMYDAVVGIKPDGSISKINPLIQPGCSWFYLKAAQVKSQEICHGPRSYLDSNELKNYSFIVLTCAKFESGDVSFSAESLWLTRLCEELSEISDRTQSIDYGVAICSFKNIYEHLQSETVENQKGMVHFVLAKPVDGLLLRLMGANVYVIHIEYSPGDAGTLSKPNRTIRLFEDDMAKPREQMLDEIKRASLDALLTLH